MFNSFTNMLRLYSM